MSKTEFATVVRRLDLLDGISDGQYTDMSLQGSNATSVCLAEEETKPLVGSTVPLLTNGKGEIVFVDCSVLSRRLKQLISIAERNPTQQFIQKAIKGDPSVLQRQPPPAEEFFVYFLIDHAIVVTLLGNWTTQDLPDAIWPMWKGAYPEHVGAIRAMGGIVPWPAFQQFQVEGLQEVERHLKDFGRRHGADLTMFPSAPADPQEPAPQNRPPASEGTRL